MDGPQLSSVPTTLEYAATRPSTLGKGFLGLALSFFLPGLGQWAAGRRRRGMLWFAACIGSQVPFLFTLRHPTSLPYAIALSPVAILIPLSMWIDAFLCARKSVNPLLGRAWKRYGAGIGLVIAALFIGPYTLMNNFFGKHMRTHYVEAFRVRGGSMSPCLADGDLVLAHKHAEWERWSIVFISHPEYGKTQVVSRIVGLPGEQVEIRDGKLFVNGHSVNPPNGTATFQSMAYAGRYDTSLRGKPGAGCKGNPIRLGENEYFLLGDNGLLAFDARLWEMAVDDHPLGALPESRIGSRVTMIYWPPTRWRVFD